MSLPGNLSKLQETLILTLRDFLTCSRDKLKRDTKKTQELKSSWKKDLDKKISLFIKRTVIGTAYYNTNCCRISKVSLTDQVISIFITFTVIWRIKMRTQSYLFVLDMSRPPKKSKKWLLMGKKNSLSLKLETKIFLGGRCLSRWKESKRKLLIKTKPFGNHGYLILLAHLLEHLERIWDTGEHIGS